MRKSTKMKVGMRRWRAMRRSLKELKRRRRRRWLSIPMKVRREILATVRLNALRRKEKAGRQRSEDAAQS